jgi:hypothetical protein
LRWSLGDSSGSLECDFVLLVIDGTSFRRSLGADDEARTRDIDGGQSVVRALSAALENWTVTALGK